MRSAWVLLGSLVVLASGVACGGGNAGTKPKDGTSANDADGGGSIGNLVLQNGGLDTLGGGSNSNGSGLSSSLKLDLVEKDQKVLLDGIVKEWPARTAATTVVKGSAVKATFGLQYDDAKVYVAGEIADEKFTRTGRFGDDEDHASLIVATPSLGVQTGSYTAVEIGFYAGKPGESAGAVRFLSGPSKGRDVPGAKIVEAPLDKGYAFEAQLPWSVVAPSGVHLGLRGAMRYYDSEGSGIKSVVATSNGDVASPSALATLPSESEQSMIDGFLSPKGLLATAPKVDIIADVVGDGQKDRITVYDRYLTVLGPGYRGGKEFFFRDFGADLVKLETKDVTGRGKEDLLIRRRFAPSGGSPSTREWFEVWSFLGDEPTTTFAHEISVSLAGKQVTNAIRASSKEIEITYEPAQGWDVTTYREATASDVEPVLLPWGAIKSQLYKYDNGKFAKLKEVSQTPQPGAATNTYTVSQKPPEPPTPVVKTNTDLGKSMLDKFKADRGIAATERPRFDVEVHVDGDNRAERVVAFGRDICVFGPGFKNGTAYAYITLSQFAADADVKDFAVRDLTGDGAADITVRGVRHVTAAGQGNVDMDVLFIYQVKAEAITRVFGIETGREQTGKRVQGMVQFIPAAGGKGFDIDVSPGRATGWTDKTYPWGQDQPGTGAIEPLLLPWGGIAHLKYSWNGTTFAKAP